LDAVAKSGTDSLPFSLVIEHLPGNPYSTGGFARASVFLPASPDIPIAWMYRNTWKDAEAFEMRARKLAGEFSTHFDRVYGSKGLPEAVRRQCPGK